LLFIQEVHEKGHQESPCKEGCQEDRKEEIRFTRFLRTVQPIQT